MTARGRTAIVTGGGRGIGAAVARALTARGRRASPCSPAPRAELDRVVAERAAALAVAGDVRREEDVARLVAVARVAPSARSTSS